MTFNRISLCAALLLVVGCGLFGCGKEEKGQENPEVPQKVELKDGSASPEGMGDPAAKKETPTPKEEGTPTPAPTPKEEGTPTPPPTPEEDGTPTPAPTPKEDKNTEGPTLAPPETNPAPAPKTDENN